MQKNSNQWPQNYQEILDTIDSELNSEPDFNFSPTRSTMSPKGSIGKLTKRRSRASKKTPITLLKADADNFRALVQQFTGLQSGAPDFGSYKGPINLNFEQCTYYYTKHTEAKAKQKQLVDHNNNNSGVNSAPANIVEDDDELFGARDDGKPRAETLTIEGHDVEEIWGSGDYSTLLPGTGSSDHGFWGY